MLIAFSGLDGAGKSTQIELLLKDFRARGAAPVFLWARGGYTPLFNWVKTLIRKMTGGKALPPSGRSQARNRSFSKPWVRYLWLQMALFDLVLTYGIRVRWWLATGKTVVCDRYIWDTLIDFRLNFPNNPIEKYWLWRLLKKVAPIPSVSFLMIIPVSESLRRSELKAEPFPDSADVLSKRREMYLSMTGSAKWILLDGTKTIEEVHAQVWSSLPPLSNLNAAGAA